ncbi:MAG: MFS transporter [Candidatus Heimdallarchaeota archaeon]|nr:MFS transporter [Candidatus Heimdallarchaeota archaeon]
MTQNQTTTTNEIENKHSLASYLTFLSGQWVSSIGSRIVQFSIIWWITITTLDPFMLGLAAFLGLGSQILVGLFAGVFVDRYSRKKIIGTVDFLQALATFILIYLFTIGESSITSILILLTLRGAFQGLQDPALRAIIPVLVPRDKLTKINSMNFLANGLIALSGPVIAAVLIGFVGIENLHIILWADVVTFLIAVVPLIFVKIPSVVKSKQGEKSSFRKEFGEGFGFLRERRGLLNLLIMYAGINLVLSSFFVILPLAVIDLFDGDEYILAIALGANQAGTILISLLLSGKTLFKKNTTGIFLGIFFGVFGILIIGFAAIFGSVEALIAGMVIIGLGIPVANVHSMTIWQTVVPLDLQGRVISVRMVISQIVSPVSLLGAGIVAKYTGITVLILGVSIFGLLLLFYSWFFTSLPQVEQTINLEKIEKDKLPAGAIPTE